MSETKRILSFVSIGLLFAVVNARKVEAKELTSIDKCKLSTVYISYTDTLTRQKRFGTGFLAWCYQDTGSKILVVNKHMLGRTHFFDIRVPMRLVLTSGEEIMSTGVQRISLYDSKGRKLWRALTDTSVDLIALKVKNQSWKFANPGTPFIGIIATALTKCIFAGAEQIEEGDFVYFTGYPLGLVGRESPHPIVRLGMIASLKGEDLLGRSLIIVDAAGFPGSSGSPVILSPLSAANLISAGKDSMIFVGMVVSYTRMQPVRDTLGRIKKLPNESPDTVEIVFDTRENSHLMSVIPALFVKKTLALIDSAWAQ